MDEAAHQGSSHSLSSASSFTSASVRRPGSSHRQHRRTGSVGTVSEHEVNPQETLKRCGTTWTSKRKRLLGAELAENKYLTNVKICHFSLWSNIHCVSLQVRSVAHSSRSSVTSASGVSVNSASSMDSLNSVLNSESDGQPSTAEELGRSQQNTEVHVSFCFECLGLCSACFNCQNSVLASSANFSCYKTANIPAAVYHKV